MQHNKKYQVFISSTFTDLQEERRRVQDAVLKMNHFPVGMELFSAASDDQWSIIQRTIDSSDYYVLVIGYRYGSEMDNGISYTQKEYEYAKEHNVPILAFIKKDGVSSTPTERDDSRAKIKKLQKFINDVKDGRLVEWWSYKEELCQKVVNALYQEFDINPRPGWVRSYNDIEEIQTELVRQNKKIRELEEENNRLKSQASSRRPMFEFLINDADRLELQLPKWDGENIIRAEYFPVDIEEYREMGINEKRIAKYEKFNASLPEEETLNSYIDAKKHYDLAKECAIPVTFTIGNIGNTKASDVFMEIKFPESLAVYDKEMLEALIVPEKPPRAKIPEEEQMERMMGLSSSMVKLMVNPLITTPFKRISPLVLRPNGNEEHIEDNTLNIRRNQIMHTRCLSLSDYYVVPLKEGEFEIIISIICEEYPEQENLTFPIIIQKS